MARRAVGSATPAVPVTGALRAPRYHQVYVALRGWIIDGSFPRGSRIPTEPELCLAFGVSRITVRRAIDELVAERLLIRRQGSGTFVPQRLSLAPVALDLSQMTARIANLGRTTEVADPRVEWVRADPATAAALELEPGARVHKSSRVRVAGGERMGLVTVWLREDVGRLVSRRDLRRSTVLEVIERCGVRVESAEQSIGASLAGIEAARARAVPVGVPLVRIERVVKEAEGRPVERVEALWRADRYQYRMQLRRERRGGLSGWVPD